MKRRDFVIGATTAAGVVLIDSARAAAPCPPVLHNSTSGQQSCPQSAGGADLATQSGQLDAGEWAFSIRLPNNVGQWDISWQNRTAFWDDVHREIQFMGKAQGGGAARHFIYSEAANSWRYSSLDVWDDMGQVGGTTSQSGTAILGHVWLVTFDHATGNYFYVEQDVKTGTTDRTIRKMVRSVEAGNGPTNDPWEFLTHADFEVWSTSGTPSPGVCYHPNLLGPGKAGIYCWSTARLSYFDIDQQAWTTVSTHSGSNEDYGGSRKGASSLYVPGKDMSIFGSGKDGVQEALIMPAGGADNKTPRFEPLPVRVKTSTDLQNTAHMLIDPRDDGTIMLLERAATGRVWTNANGGDGSSWTLEPFTHPFWDNLPVNPNDAGSWTPCSISRYGVVLGMASYGSAAKDGADGTIMWRPG